MKNCNNANKIVGKRLFLPKDNDNCRKTSNFVTNIHINKVKMEGKDLNRLKVVLAEKKRTNKWLAEQIGVDPATVSKWCTNTAQPNLENLIEISKSLEVDVSELIRM